MSKPEKMTDYTAEAILFLEAEAMRYAASSPNRVEMLACASHLRASEAEKDAEIQRLRAELARLQPSGQVADDEAKVRAVLGIIVATSSMDKRDALAALFRLASLAQAAQEKDGQIKALADALKRERTLVDLLYHNIMSGKDKATMADALETARTVIELRSEPTDALCAVGRNP